VWEGNMFPKSELACAKTHESRTEDSAKLQEPNIIDRELPRRPLVSMPVAKLSTCD